MNISARGRYGVMAMVDLALVAKGRPVVLADIAARVEISLSYLEQLFAALRRCGLVRSARGPGGGYVLAREAQAIRISDILHAVGEPIHMTRCRPNSADGCRQDNSRCLTHDLWQEMSNRMMVFLDSVSLMDVVEHRIYGSGGVLFPEQLPVVKNMPHARGASS